MTDLLICKDSCWNDHNTYPNCLDFFSKYLDSSELKTSLKAYYFDCLWKHNTKKIHSMSFLDWELAIKVLFDDIAELFLWCKNLKRAIISLNENFDESMPTVLRLETIAKINLLLYWPNNNSMKKLLAISSDLDIELSTDLYKSVVKMIDSVYRVNSSIDFHSI